MTIKWITATTCVANKTIRDWSFNGLDLAKISIDHNAEIGFKSEYWSDYFEKLYTSFEKHKLYSDGIAVIENRVDIPVKMTSLLRMKLTIILRL